MIFWRHIKGLNQGNESTATEVYTYLEFSSIFDTSVSNTEAERTSLPQLKVCNYNKLSGSGNEKDYGYIITQKGKNQSIDTAFEFTKYVNFSNTTSGEYSFEAQGKTSFQDNIYLKNGKAIYLNGTTGTAFLQNASNACYLHSSGPLYLDSGTTANNVYIRQGETVRATFDNNGLEVVGKCQAPYFNATSDKRAKTNIKPLEINALDLINRIQLYSFKYKDSDLPSIGILAQDVQDVNIEGFDLVDNKEASGVDMDYMSIHESKLIYVLWKAIQEQQKEIDDLKAQLAK